jgi:hypothetical protein
MEPSPTELSARLASFAARLDSVATDCSVTELSTRLAAFAARLRVTSTASKNPRPTFLLREPTAGRLLFLRPP